MYFISSERCPSQSQPPQVLQTGGEREGRRLDCGRYRVPQEEEPQGEQPVDQVRHMMSVMSDHLIENIKFSVCHLYVKSLLGALLTFLI